jgi:beta-mannanase
MKKIIYLILTCLILNLSYSKAQLKYLIEDFEGFADNQTGLKKEGLFTYGSAHFQIDQKFALSYGYSGARALKVDWKKGALFGGWGIGITSCLDLEEQKDFLNFYIYNPKINKRSDNIKITLEEDDNNNTVYEKEHDDTWSYSFKQECKDGWQLVSIPLLSFKDGNKGGDGKFNVSYKNGKLLTFIVSFLDTNMINDHQTWYFDFICFSKGKLPTTQDQMEPNAASPNDTCALGAWSEVGNGGNFIEIPKSFEGLLNNGTVSKQLEVVHTFKPFSAGGGTASNLYFDLADLNNLIHKGYTPMITIEDHFVQVSKKQKQPNLYSIVEGHFDYHFKEWAKRLKAVDGIVLLRILHEFNGDWYPWCIAKNDKNPELFKKAYRHIRTIFNEQNAWNVKFIWCPNSKSSPQESWNYIMDAYPGNEYVDYVGMDVYNGAGEMGVPVWRSFRKEAIENYFLMTDKLSDKPLIICETASRERKMNETGHLQSKAEWMAQMSEALKSDLSKIRLVCWFNQYSNFKINSSNEAKEGYYTQFWLDPYYHKRKVVSVK